MTVMIKGMKKPTVCYKCPLRTGKYCGILTENEKCADDGVLPHCPIAEAQTPHGRLIDADKLKNDIPETDADCFENCRDCTLLHREDVWDIIDDATTVIESEIEDE